MTEVLAPQSPAEVAAAIRHVLGNALGYLHPAALRVAASLGISDHLVDGPKTATHLAELTGASAGHLYRVLRFLAMRGVYREDESGAFHLTPPAELLRGDCPLPVRSAVLLFSDEMYWRPAGRLDDTLRKGSTVFDDIFGAQFFDHLERDEERARLFNTALATLSATEQGAIVDSYDFPATGTVVDIAGGLGGFLRTVLSRNTGLRGVLFDRAPVLDQHRLGEDSAIAGRWEIAAGDFFTAVPPGADIYVLKRIVHDKSEADIARILRTCRAAMTDSARLLIVDAVVAPGEIPPGTMISDVLMMTVFEGRERTEEEFSDLLRAAGLRLRRVVGTPTALSIIEAVPA